VPAVKKVKVALIGSGAISWTYLQNMTERFGILDVVGCSDIIPERSAARAKEFGIRQLTNEKIWNDPEIQIVVNTTYPSSHVEVTERSLKAGKNVHTEKMMACTYGDAVKLVKLADNNGLRISCAPDTFMGGAYQTARKLIDSGFIGKPVLGHAFQLRGYRADGPNPLARPGGMWALGSTTPVDMGGYYIHALIHLLGPIARVGGFGQANGQQFTNPKNSSYGNTIDATADTSITAALEFKSGVLGNLTVIGECYGEIPRVEIYGTEGMIVCPDPNTYSGPLYFQHHGTNELMKVPLTHDYNYYSVGEYPDKDRNWPKPFWAESRRGLGVADLAWAITNKRPHRCSAELGLHALEIIHGVEISRKQNVIYQMTTCPAQPAPLPAGFIGGAAEKALDTN
jgi:predicted dehydrogenase